MQEAGRLTAVRNLIRMPAEGQLEIDDYRQGEVHPQGHTEEFRL